MEGKIYGVSIAAYVQTIKELVRTKKLDSWNEVIEKESRKEFWAFVGWTSKGSCKGIATLRSPCITSTK